MWTELSDTAILKKLGARLKAYRISRGLKQQELAAESGVGPFYFKILLNISPAPISNAAVSSDVIILNFI